jgi:hypothetical protein
MDRTIELKEHGVSFSLPDIINTRDMLRFQAAWAQSAAGPHKEYVFVKRWELVNDLGLLENWKCEYHSDPKASLMDADDPRVAYMVIAVLNTIFEKMMTLREVSKN